MSTSVILDALACRIGHEEVLLEAQEWIKKQLAKIEEEQAKSIMDILYKPLYSEDWRAYAGSQVSTEESESSTTAETVPETTCIGCIENQPNQMAHMDFGGCLHSSQ